MSALLRSILGIGRQLLSSDMSEELSMPKESAKESEANAVVVFVAVQWLPQHE
jgi:hypothetical protein